MNSGVGSTPIKRSLTVAVLSAPLVLLGFGFVNFMNAVFGDLLFLLSAVASTLGV